MKTHLDSSPLEHLYDDIAGAAIAPSTQPERPSHPWRTAGRHFAEMVIAMVLGMLLLGPVWNSLAVVTGLSSFFARPTVSALVMATNMTIAMSIWMRHRGHGWRSTGEMGAAMYVPFAVTLPPFWAGAWSADTALMGGHVLMLPAMAVAMLIRRGEYTTGHHHRSEDSDLGASAQRGAASRVVDAIKHRWPTWLALVMTIDCWLDPSMPPPWALLVLPGAYLLFGTVRKQFRDRRLLVVQLAGLLGYAVLTAAALTADAELTRYFVAAGWLLHALWDAAHFKARTVVPRGYAEWCFTFDLVVGLTILFLW
ncbi:hypothetical protein [Kribbella sp. NPDC023855]|uniref:hypothetical protein n=1 Tax=Kribbella sp. NPDC023855 TaxID=3154698 RepID=UPI0033BFF713